jgi:hypothetical protein
VANRLSCRLEVCYKFGLTGSLIGLFVWHGLGSENWGAYWLSISAIWASVILFALRIFVEIDEREIRFCNGLRTQRVGIERIHSIERTRRLYNESGQVGGRIATTILVLNIETPKACHVDLVGSVATFSTKKVKLFHQTCDGFVNVGSRFRPVGLLRSIAMTRRSL